MTKIFISHSNNDSKFALELAQALINVGIDVWIDKSNIRAGQIWWDEIQRGLDECDMMILVLSPDAMASRNVADEWGYYLSEKKQIFTVRWIPGKVHFRLSGIQYVDFHEQEFMSTFEKLASELRRNGISVNGTGGELHLIRTDNYLSTLRVEDILPPPFEWIVIPGGKVTLTNASNFGGTTGGIYTTPTFTIAKYPITSAQYEIFVKTANGFQNPDWWDYSEDAKEWRKDNPLALWNAFPGDNHPRTNVTWYEAIAFCRWLSSLTSLQITLPTEQQWQRAAVGDTENVYPWGNDFDINKCNSFDNGIYQTTAVTCYPEGASPYGVMDMSGNVFEWCLTKWGVDKNDLGGVTLRHNRGGAYSIHKYGAEAQSRTCKFPHKVESWVGFRIVQNH